MQQIATIFSLKVEKNIIDFFNDCAGESGIELTSEFKNNLLNNNIDELFNWFSSKGYTISIDDCDKLLKNKKNLPIIKKNVTRASY